MDNPYKSAGKPTLRKSLVCFLDLLGQKLSGENRPVAQDYLVRLRDAFDSAYPYLSEPGRSEWLAKAFTDNIVVATPLYSDGESDLGFSAFTVGAFQLEMVNRGFLMRGGLAIGDIYLDDEIVFGDGLIAAYRAESALARDPRVVLADSAAKAVQKHIGYYTPRSGAPQIQSFLVDADGQLFLNYLYAALDPDTGAPFRKVIKQHRDVIAERLVEFKSNPIVWSKCFWVANYHNWFCQRYCSARGTPRSLMIKPSLLTIEPYELS